jgi:hypothetical protein
MDQPLDFLKSRIPNFPGYASDDDRRVSDELVRSYLGERLADMEMQDGISDDARKSVGDLLLRTGFTNQIAYKVYAEAARTNHNFDAMAAADAATVELADTAGGVTPDGVSQFVQQSARVLDGRDLAMRGEPAPTS